MFLAFLPRRRSPNNDAREKQRAAAKRSSVPSAGKPSAAGFAQPKKQLADDGIVQLYSNCIKLASENKISQKNTWALELIDHISDIIKLEKDKDDGTNFTKASCTLDAGVKIYSTRVDSVHNEAFRMLGGLSRAAIESQQQEGADDEGDSGDEDGEGGAKKRRAKKQNTDMSATLEASFEALNAKADEVYTAVDPLFKQMSAKFDQGGAKGLLLNNLSCYGGCEIVFDSAEAPAAKGRARGADAPSATIDLGACAEQMQIALAAMKGAQITPGLSELRALAKGEGETDDDGAHAAEVPLPLPAAPTGLWEVVTADDDDDDMDGGGADFDLDFGGGGDFDDDEEEVGAADMRGTVGQAAAAGTGARNGGVAAGLSELTMGDNPMQWLTMSYAQMATAKGAWAGPEHWRPASRTAAARAKEQGEQGEGGEETAAKKAESERKRGAKKAAMERALDFENPPELDLACFDEGKPEDIDLKTDAAEASTLLPDDMHYSAESLSKLFMHRGAARVNAAPHAAGSIGGGAFGWAGEGEHSGGMVGDSDDEGGAGGYEGGGDAGGDDDDELDFGDGGGGAFDMGLGDDAAADAGALSFEAGAMDAPRMVEKVQVTFSKYAKQVDVRKLKAACWSGMEDIIPEDGSNGAVTQFQDVLDRVPSRMPAQQMPEVSIHLAFICALHLANEHTLKITDDKEGALDVLTISRDG